MTILVHLCSAGATAPTTNSQRFLQHFEVLDDCHRQMVEHVPGLGELVDHTNRHSVDKGRHIIRRDDCQQCPCAC